MPEAMVTVTRTDRSIIKVGLDHCTRCPHSGLYYFKEGDTQTWFSYQVHDGLGKEVPGPEAIGSIFIKLTASLPEATRENIRKAITTDRAFAGEYDAQEGEGRWCAHVLVLNQHREQPIVFGNLVRPVGIAAYHSLKLLIQAGPEGLDQPRLEARYGSGDPVNALRRLAKTSDDRRFWNQVIGFPGGSWGANYRIIVAS